MSVSANEFEKHQSGTAKEPQASEESVKKKNKNGGWTLENLLNKITVPFSAGIFLTSIVCSGAMLLIVIAYTGGDPGKISIAMLAAFAAGAIGCTVGFLFGVPRGPSNKAYEQRNADNTYRPNTNLEQVSDWLTKIIVGVGLIQFPQIGLFISDVGHKVGAAIGDIPNVPDSGTVFAIGVMVASSAVTFILAYMWTTTELFDVYEGRGRRGRRRNG